MTMTSPAELLEFPVEALNLNSHNPRFHTPTTSEKVALNAILNLSPAKLLNLARDIAQSGSLSPADLPIVVIKQGQPVVLEGNRRVAALKLLRNPDLADDALIR